LSNISGGSQDGHFPTNPYAQQVSIIEFFKTEVIGNQGITLTAKLITGMYVSEISNLLLFDTLCFYCV